MLHIYVACALRALAVDRVCTEAVLHICGVGRVLTPAAPGAAGDPVATAGTVEVPDFALKSALLGGLPPASSKSEYGASF